MRGTPVGLAIVAVILSFALATGVSAQTSVELVGEDIPQRYIVGTSYLFVNSDSLYLNDSLLVRGVDYTFDSRRGAFDLSRITTSSADTLRIVYRAVPSWLRSFYGDPLPEVGVSSNAVELRPPAMERRPRKSGGRDIDISGAKTFRFTTRSAASSEFSQSLDLKITGQLSPGLELSGAISDRGYDPSYGTANSRLNELDKLNLRLSSRTFVAQVGDIILDQQHLAGAGTKRVSGASIAFENESVRANAAAARPRGRFETARFYGRDGTQGPYRIDQGTGARSIVPGSETVWLDGRQLERGANKDYMIDYPASRVTFNVNHPIDSRSRIEIDFEPLQTSYKGELYAGGGGVSLYDSTVNIDVQWLREGDDRDEPIVGELSSEELSLLDSIGDSTSLAYRSGARADTLGSYVLVPDSLPDSVFQYVGDSAGEYSVTFSYFGSGKGDYVYQGGSQYVFVGSGRGDYKPLVIVPVPERTDYYLSSALLRDLLFTEVRAEFQQTQNDRNLFSERDDGDNGASYWAVTADKRWEYNGRRNSLSLATQMKEADFKARRRLYRADFSRSYMLPDDFVASSDESRHDFAADVTPLEKVTIAPFYSLLSYEGALRSDNVGTSARWQAFPALELGGGFRVVRTDVDTLAGSVNGQADTYDGRLNLKVGRGFDFGIDYERDARKNNYSGLLRGTRYHRTSAVLDHRTEQLTYELYLEDTLSGRWIQQIRRNRVSGTSSRRVSNVSYSTLVTYQWLTVGQSDNNSFLGRLTLNYNDSRRQLVSGATYALSEETRNSRGIAYLEVAAGEGDYVLDNGEFVPDPDGNYIRVEENLSDLSQVRRAEKSFHFDKTWPGVTLRLNSNIEEELLPGGERKFWWVVPFLSDPDQPYLFYQRRYHGDLRLVPIRFGHAINLTYAENRETRDIAGASRNRADYTGAVGFKQAAGNSLFEERVELFRNDRDVYYTGGGKSDGYKAALNYRLLVVSGEVSSGVSFRRAEADNGDRSDIYALLMGSRVSIVKKGEVRSEIELYRQTLKATSEPASFVLTDNKYGKRGAIWSVGVRYGIKGGMRVNLTVSGRHSDDRTARITGRGEFVAGF